MSKLPTNVTKVAAGLVSGAEGCGIIMRGKYSPVFVQQGDLDGACGTHCLFMALMALRVIPRSQFFQLGSRKVGTDLRRLWHLAQSFYFSGTDAQDFRRLLSLVAAKVDFDTTEAMDNAAERFITGHLDQGQLVIVGIESAQKKLNHWVLAIGQSGTEDGGKFQATDFLIVDPDNEPDRLVPWNATLKSGATRRSRLLRRLVNLRGAEMPVRLSGAIALSRSARAERRPSLH